MNQCKTVTLKLNIANNASFGTFLEVKAEVTNNSNICVKNKEVIVPIIITATPDAGFTFSKIPCNNTVQFTANVPNTNHTWDFGDGNIVNGANPSHTYYTTSCNPTATVKHTVFDNCGSKTETQTINLSDCPVPTATLVSNIKTLCVGPQINIPLQLCLNGIDPTSNTAEITINTSNLPTGVTLVNGGNFTNGTAIITGIIPNNYISSCKNLSLFLNVDAAVGTIINLPITVTVKKGNCPILTFTQTITYTVIKCQPSDCPTCTNETAISIITSPQSYRISQFITPNEREKIFLSGVCLEITGSLVIDVPTTFTNCEVRMHAGAEIRVEASLKASQTWMHGCKMMWRGISVDSDASLTLETNSTIEDAVHAVTLQPNTAVSINETTFNKNYIGVYSPPGGTIDVASFQLLGSTFKCDGALLPDPTGMAQGGNTFAGVYLNNAAIINIGSEGGAENRFTGIRNGIIAVGGLVNAYNNHFSKLVGGNPNDPYTAIPNFAGCGILIRANKASPPIQIKKNSFEGCIRAIIVEKSSADVSSNVTYQVYHAILLRYGANKKMSVYNNSKIEAFLTGVEMDYCAKPTLMYVGYNDIHILNPKNTTLAYGIYANNSIVEKQQGIIRSNKLAIESGEGILLLASKGFLVEYNPIEGKSGDFRGINLQGSEGCIIQDNAVRGAGADVAPSYFPFSVAINAENSAKNDYACNDVSQTKYGVRFWGDCEKENSFTRTTFRSHDTSLYLEDAVMGEQDHTANTWEYAKNLTADAVCDGDPSESPFLVSDKLGRFLPITIIPDLGWFTPKDGVELACEQLAEPPHIVEPPIIREQYEVSETDIRNALGKLYGGKHADGLNRIAQQRLYATLRESDYLLGQNKVVDAFYNNTAPEDLRDLDYNRRIVVQLNRYTPEEQQQIDKVEQSINATLSKVTTLDANAPTDSNDEVALQQYAQTRSALTAAWYIEQQALDAVMASVMEQRTATIESLREGYRRIESTHLVAKNEVLVKDIYLRDFALVQNDLDKEAIQKLQSVALQCPLDGGLAVYEARALLYSIKPTWYDDQVLCSEGQPIFSRQAAAKQTDSFCKIYPNPATNFTYMTFNTPISNPTTVEVYDLTGQVVKTIEIATLTNFVEIDTHEWNSGVYFVKTYFTTPQIVKLVIIK